jgi:hypothetical protein
MVRNLTEDDTTMQDRFTIPRDALELNNTISAKAIAAACSRPDDGALAIRAERLQRMIPSRPALRHWFRPLVADDPGFPLCPFTDLLLEDRSERYSFDAASRH